MEKYSQLSTSSLLSGVITVVILLLICAIPYIINMELWGSWMVLGVIISLFIMLTFIGLYNYPLSITVDPDSLNVNYVVHVREIQLSKIVNVSCFHKDTYFVPVFGSYGYIGWWGFFYHSDLGVFTLTASNIKELVTLELNNGKIIVISCSDADEMVHQIKRYQTI